MSVQGTAEPFTILACDIQARPPGAPGVADVKRSLLHAKRGADTLTLSFALAGAPVVEAFVAAEQACCSTLTWETARTRSRVCVTISAAPEQLDVLEQVFAT
jgi:hypothetical protein